MSDKKSYGKICDKLLDNIEKTKEANDFVAFQKALSELEQIRKEHKEGLDK